MAIPIPEFWKLAVESRLLAPHACAQWEAEFAQVKGASGQPNAKALAEWLVAKKAISRYQATILLAGRAGPFDYGDYRVWDRVEQGPLRGQFRALHLPTGHPVLLRFLPGKLLTDDQAWNAVVARVKTQMLVTYPAVQRYWDAVDLQSFRFLVSEDVSGDSLAELVATHGRVPPSEAIRIARLVACALSHLHYAHIMHGNVRASQVLYDMSGNIKLLVDPLAPRAAIEADKVDYLAPEFLNERQPADELTDVYAVGCLLYHMLAGQPPFAGGTPREVMQRHASAAIKPLDYMGVPEPLSQAITYMMAKNRQVRTAHAAQIADQLAPFVDPARLTPNPNVPPTQAAYEAFLQQAHEPPPSELNIQRTKPRAPPRPQFDFTEPAAPAVMTAPEIAPPPVEAPSVALEIPPLAPSPAKPAAKRLPPRVAKKGLDPLVMIGGGAAALVVLVIGLIVALNSGGGGDKGNGTPDIAKNNTPKPPVVATNNPPVVKPPLDKPMPPPMETVKPPKNVDPPPSTAKYEIKADDGELLWASPTEGEPIDFVNVPPNAQVFLHVRPSEMLVSPAGQQVFASLGPTFAAQRDAWEKATGTKFEEISELLVSLHDSGGTMPRLSYRVTLKTAVPEAELRGRWGELTEEATEGDKFYTAAGRAFYLPAAAKGSQFVVGDPAEMKELATAKGMAPVMRRELEQLRRLTDTQRHCTLLFAPNYLSTGTRDLFSGPYEKLLGPIVWFLGDEAKGAMVSMHFAEPFYVELREIADASLDKTALAKDLRARLQQMPKHIEDYITALNPPPYWKKVAGRYPGMIYYLHRQTRIGVEDDVAMVNAVAPSFAAPNLVLGGELALASVPGGGTTNTGAPSDKSPKTLDELLNHTIDFEVQKNDLNLVLTDLEKEVKGDLPSLPFEFSIKILGKDLEADGITRNQSIVNFKMEKAKLGDVLTGLMQKANPGVPVKDPTSPDQKLLWVIGPDPDQPAKQIILVTTRKAAEAKKYKLRPPFGKG